SKLTKLRLLAIYIIAQRGISEADRRSLIQLAGLSSDEQQVLLNLERLGVSLQQSKQSTVCLLAVLLLLPAETVHPLTFPRPFLDQAVFLLSSGRPCSSSASKAEHCH